MAIRFQCEQCGKQLRCPDETAGKRTKCPQCGTRITVPQADAELAVEVEAEFDSGVELAEDPYSVRPEHTPKKARRPCPICGEMIVVGAAKCRFCDEVFDASIGVVRPVDKLTIIEFRKNIHGLGGLWILIGLFYVFLTYLLVFVRNRFPALDIELTDRGTFFWVATLLVLVSGLFLTAGICSCLKQMWAIYTGLVLSYFCAICNVIGNFSGEVIYVEYFFLLLALIVAVIQGHRTLCLAWKMQRARMPLTTSPEGVRKRRRTY